MKQTRIETVAQALSKSEIAATAATEHGAAINIKHNTGPVITVDRTALVTKENQHMAARKLLVLNQAALRAVILLVITFLLMTREFLKVHLGSKHSTVWIDTGFKTSLAMPRNVAGLKLVLEAQVKYLTDNPTHGSVELNITADRALMFLDDLRNAENAVSNQKLILGTAKTARDAAFDALRNRLRALFKELNTLLDPLSNVYPTFGFNKPGALATPAVPSNVIAVLGLNNNIDVTWNAAARAERYRVWVKVHGVDADFVLKDTREELDCKLIGLPANTKVEIAVSAINNGGESERTEVVSITTAA
jgi:hypothetical protein